MRLGGWAFWAGSLACVGMALPALGVIEPFDGPAAELRVCVALGLLCAVFGYWLHRVAHDGAAVHCADGHAVLERTGPRYRRAEGPVSGLRLIEHTRHHKGLFSLGLDGLYLDIGRLSAQDHAALQAHIDAAAAAATPLSAAAAPSSTSASAAED
jgi:hypothetical protein